MPSAAIRADPIERQPDSHCIFRTEEYWGMPQRAHRGAVRCGMRRYELVTVVTNGHRIEGGRGLILAFFGKILAFFGNKTAILQLFTGVTVVTAVTDGPRWSQVVTVGHRIGEGWVRPWTHPRFQHVGRGRPLPRSRGHRGGGPTVNTLAIFLRFSAAARSDPGFRALPG